jgi:hypothetical protein
MTYFFSDAKRKTIFNNEEGLHAGNQFPTLPEDVVQVRTTEDGVVERFSETDWSWQPAPELAYFVEQAKMVHEQLSETVALEKEAQIQEIINRAIVRNDVITVEPVKTIPIV